MKRLILCIVLAMTVSACEGKKPTIEQPQSVSAAPEIPKNFNTSDKSIITNDNIIVAAYKVQDSAGDLWADAEVVTASQLTKSPYSSIGKKCKITGKIFKVEELPPSLGLKGRWGELLLLVKNPNSPLGATTIDYIYEGDISKINSGQIVTCTGFFLGTNESENSMGGVVESIVFLGNRVTRR